MRLPFPDQVEQTPVLHKTGVLPSQRIRDLISSARIAIRKGINCEFDEDQIQPASIDLRLGEVAYRVQGSFLPGKLSTVYKKIQDLKMAEIDLRKSAVLEKGCVYIVPLLEELHLPDDLSAKANPRSTTGRLDIFTRLITDYGEEFDWVRKGYTGKLYAEVVSRTFAVKVGVETKLNQLRFIRGTPPYTDNMLMELDEKEILVYEEEDNPVQANIKGGLRISVDLRGNGDTDVVAHKAKKHAPVIEPRRPASTSC